MASSSFHARPALGRRSFHLNKLYGRDHIVTEIPVLLTFNALPAVICKVIKSWEARARLHSDMHMEDVTLIPHIGDGGNSVFKIDRDSLAFVIHSAWFYSSILGYSIMMNLQLLEVTTIPEYPQLYLPIHNSLEPLDMGRAGFDERERSWILNALEVGYLRRWLRLATMNHQKSDVKQPKSPAATHALIICYLSPWMLLCGCAG